MDLIDLQEFHCACVIHGNVYSWEYVEKLYNSLCRNCSRPVKLHVFTEKSRTVPDHMIKHELEEWPEIRGPRSAWWYKMQLFDPKVSIGRILYLDLDVVIAGNLDWIWTLDPKFFWTVKDFKYLWKKSQPGINSSVMLWSPPQVRHIWRDFHQHSRDYLRGKFFGDQDYLNTLFDDSNRRFFDDSKIKSWRWEIKDGGLDFKTKIYRSPNAGSLIPPDSAILVFHGRPKPHEIQDTAIQSQWC